MYTGVFYSNYRRKARRRLKTISRTSSSAAATVTDGDESKKNYKVRTRSRRHGDVDRTGARSATMRTARALDRGDPGTLRTSWQRVRPLPLPRLPPDLPPTPLDDSPPGAVSPPDAEVPLLSSLRLPATAAPHRADPGLTRRPPSDGERSAEIGHRRLTSSGGGSSPYYYKLDPALTARHADRHQRFYSHNPCFMCESEMR